jgi:iron complex outermembrane recepter protein
MKSRNTIRDAVRFALTAGVAASVAQAPAAFGADDDAARLDRVEVTGSRIKRLDIEGPSPVTVITREDIEASGDISVADVLRESTFNSFGSFAESSGFTAQSQATISLRGVGANRTLVLLDGRRMAGSAILDGGQTANLNVIPIAAVERIEILRDGASAIYGTDAIGGVVNIILRHDYEGMRVSASYGESSWGEPNESSAAIVGGISGGSGNITFALDHQERGMFFDSDRPWSTQGISAFGFPGTMSAFSSGGGTVINPDPSSEFVAGNGGFWFPDPRCPANLGDSTEFPNSGSSLTIPGFCNFNYASFSATQASLKRDSLMMTSTYEINQDLSFFTRVTISNTESFGRYAPAPNTFFPTVAASNPNNPSNPNHPLFANSQFNNTTQSAYCTASGYACPYDGNGVYQGPFDLSLFIRMVPNGPRDAVAQDRLMDILFGVDGYVDWFGGAEYTMAYGHSRNRFDNIGTGYGIHSLLQNAIDAGTYSPFAPIDPQGSGGLGDSAPFAHTTINDSESVRETVDAQLSFDLFEMSNGPVGFVVGAEYTEESFASLNDAQSVAGNVFGTAGGNSQGSRHFYSVYSEVVLPILDNLEVDIALRYDNYQGFGDTVNPKIAVAYRPMDNLLLRMSWGTGFRAPDLFILNQVPTQSFPGAIDVLACNLNPSQTGAGQVCSNTQYETLYLSDPNLSPEESENFSAGAVWNPIDSLEIGLQWYNIELTNQIANISLQQLLNLEAAGSALVNTVTTTGNCDRSITSATIQRDTGTNRIVCANAPAVNLSGFKTSGWDLDITYRFGIGDVGEFEVFGTFAYITRFDTEVFVGDGFGDALGFSAPDFRANAGVNWALGDHAVTLLVNHIAASNPIGFPNVVLDSYTTWDLQYSWATPWDGKITVGARNLFAEDPPIDTTGQIGHPQWSRFLHDALGRVPYIRYEQDL